MFSFYFSFFSYNVVFLIFCSTLFPLLLTLSCWSLLPFYRSLFYLLLSFIYRKLYLFLFCFLCLSFGVHSLFLVSLSFFQSNFFSLTRISLFALFTLSLARTLSHSIGHFAQPLVFTACLPECYCPVECLKVILWEVEVTQTIAFPSLPLPFLPLSQGYIFTSRNSVSSTQSFSSLR